MASASRLHERHVRLTVTQRSALLWKYIHIQIWEPKQTSVSVMNANYWKRTAVNKNGSARDIATKLTQWKAELISVIILNELQQFYTLTISLMNNYWLLIDY